MAEKQELLERRGLRKMGGENSPISPPLDPRLRARLKFRAFALRDMKIAAREGCRVGQLSRSQRSQSFWLATGIAPSGQVQLRKPSKGHQHGVSIQSSMNL